MLSGLPASAEAKSVVVMGAACATLPAATASARAVRTVRLSFDDILVSFGFGNLPGLSVGRVARYTTRRIRPETLSCGRSPGTRAQSTAAYGSCTCTGAPGAAAVPLTITRDPLGELPSPWTS